MVVVWDNHINYSGKPLFMIKLSKVFLVAEKSFLRGGSAYCMFLRPKYWYLNYLKKITDNT
jgi:hypothetical protein